MPRTKKVEVKTKPEVEETLEVEEVSSEAKPEVEEAPVVAEVSNERKARWEAHVAKYAEQNPVKYAVKKEQGAFDNIPENF